MTLSGQRVYTRWYEIYRNIYIHKAVVEFLFHTMFNDIIEIKIESGTDSGVDPMQQIRSLS